MRAARADRQLRTLWAAVTLCLTATAVAAAESDTTSGLRSFVAPNIEDSDGNAAYIHVTPEDMPLVVSVGLPKRAAKYASRKQTREAAIEAMQMWEDAIQPALPWFDLIFVEKDKQAPIQIEWKRRVVGATGWGGIRYWLSSEGRLRVGGKMEVSTRIDPFTVMPVDELRLLIAHEFGHVLGLGHCLDCDSAMNYSWATRGRVLVTELDIQTFRDLVAIPNGSRTDGKLIAGVAPNRTTETEPVRDEVADALPPAED